MIAGIISEIIFFALVGLMLYWRDHRQMSDSELSRLSVWEKKMIILLVIELHDMIQQGEL